MLAAPCVQDNDRAGDQTNDGLSHPHGRIGQHPKGVGSRSRPEIDEPCEGLEHEQPGSKKRYRHRVPSPPHGPESPKGRTAHEADSYEVGTASQRQTDLYGPWVPCETEHVDVGDIEGDERNEARRTADERSTAEVLFTSDGACDKREEEPRSADVTDLRPQSAAAPVQHRHPYTKGQSGGANYQHPHQTTSVHDRNLLCTRTTFQGSELGFHNQGRRLTPLITTLATVILLDTPHVEPKCHGEFVRLLVVVSRSEVALGG